MQEEGGRVLLMSVGFGASDLVGSGPLSRDKVSDLTSPGVESCGDQEGAAAPAAGRTVQAGVQCSCRGTGFCC